jgi:hypothetical protein
LLLAFRAQNGRLPLALGLEDFCPLLAFRLHLASHRLDEVGGRHDILDLDAIDLDPPRRNRGVNHAQETLVDFVAMGEHLVKVHAAHDGADIGHGQFDDGLIEIGDLIARLGGIEDLEECNAVNRDGGIVFGDDVLLRDVDHLLHHVHLAANAVEIGHDQVEARLESAGVPAKSFDRPRVALGHRLDAGEQGEDREGDKRDDENIEAGKHGVLQRSDVGCQMSDVRCQMLLYLGASLVVGRSFCVVKSR